MLCQCQIVGIVRGRQTVGGGESQCLVVQARRIVDFDRQSEEVVEMHDGFSERYPACRSYALTQDVGNFQR